MGAILEAVLGAVSGGFLDGRAVLGEEGVKDEEEEEAGRRGG